MNVNDKFVSNKFSKFFFYIFTKFQERKEGGLYMRFRFSAKICYKVHEEASESFFKFSVNSFSWMQIENKQKIIV